MKATDVLEIGGGDCLSIKPPSITGHERREERLLRVLLEIRHRAAVHLGLTPQPSREHCWVEEYYFC